MDSLLPRLRLVNLEQTQSASALRLSNSNRFGVGQSGRLEPSSARFRNRKNSSDFSSSSFQYIPKLTLINRSRPAKAPFFKKNLFLRPFYQLQHKNIFVFKITRFDLLKRPASFHQQSRRTIRIRTTGTAHRHLRQWLRSRV